MKIRFITPTHDQDGVVKVPAMIQRGDVVEYKGRTWIVKSIRWHLDEVREDFVATVALSGRVMR